MQSFKVKPSEKSLEEPYIDRNIKATRAAYGLADADATEYKASTTATRGQLRNDADTIPGIRLVDPIVVAPTFKQLQAVKSYYQFPDALDVDRYTIDGKLRDTVIAVRELDLDGLPPASATGSTTTPSTPTASASSPPTATSAATTGSRSSTSRTSRRWARSARSSRGSTSASHSPDYSIVGGPKGGPQKELDYPDSSASRPAEHHLHRQGRRQHRLASPARRPTPSSTAS